MSYVISFRKVGLLLSLVLGMMMLSSCSKDTSKKTKPAASEDKAPSFLVVIQANEGKIIKEKDTKTNKDQHYLVLAHDHKNLHRVIGFSDRPDRIVKIISDKELEGMWKQGEDSFEKDPPNAVLSSAGQKAQIVILNGMAVTEDNIKFPISISDDEKKAIGNIVEGELTDVTLTIDEIIQGGDESFGDQLMCLIGSWNRYNQDANCWGKG